MDAGAGETHEDTEFGRGPLWTGRIAVDTLVVVVCLLDLQQLAPCLRIHLPHFAHDGQLEIYAIVQEDILSKLIVEIGRAHV